MDYFSIDHLIVYAFLLTTLVVGLLAGRGIKNMREYAIANRVYGTGVLTITFLATFIGGSTILGGVENVFKDGILPILAAWMTPVICIVWIALLIAPRMIHFEGCLTMGDIMENLYGKHGQVATGVLGFLFTICIVGGQIKALAYVYEFLLGLKSHWAIGLGGLIAITYASMGGMKAVTITDVLQFVVLVIVIPMIANVLTNEVGSIKALLSRVPAEKLQIAGHAKLGYYTSIAIFICVFSPFLLSPPFVARMLMARDKKQATHMLFMGGVGLLFFSFLIMLIGLAAFVLYPTVAPDKILPHVVSELFPIGLRGVCAAGLIAVIMSTADSFLHAAGLSVVHDVIQPLRTAKIQELRWVKYCTFGIGCAAILMALVPHSIFGIVTYGMGMMGATITIPFVAGVLGLKTDPRSFKIALWVTIPVFIAANLGFSTEIHHWAYPVSLIVNLLAFLGTHVIQNKGFMIERRTNKQYVLWHPTRSGWHTWLPTPQKLLAYSNHKLSQYGYNSTLFALFLSLNYMVPFFMYSYSNPATYGWILAIKSISIFLCLGLLLKPYWPSKLLAYFPTYYHLTLLYCLPFVTTFLFLLEERSIEWVVNVALSILFLIVLVDWITFFGLSILGVLLAIGLYKIGMDAGSVHMDVDTRYTLTYAVIFATLIGLLFARRKQKSFDTVVTQREQLIQDNQEAQGELLSATEAQIGFVHVLKKAGIEELGSAAHLSKQLLAISQQKGEIKDFEKLAQKLTDQLTPMALNMDKLVHRSTDFLRLEGVATLLLDNFLRALQQDLQERGYKPQIAVRSLQKALQCDAEKIKKVILNSFALLRSVAGEDAPLLLGIEDTKLGYPVESVSPDHIKKVAALRFTITSAATLPTLEKLYYSQVNEEKYTIPTDTSDLPLLANARIVKAHYGYSSTMSKDKDLTLIYVIPVDVRDVRSKDMDTPQMQLGASCPRADDTYPGAQGQEQAFLQAVKEKSQADLPLVEKAIHLIKDYHGPVMRKSGEPFYLHPLAVAQIVLDYNQDEATILGALLHDTVEDTPLTLEQVALLFNKEVSDIVSGVTHMESHQATTYKVLLSHPENIHRLLGEEDQRVLYVKLADRMHNMRTIAAKSHESQRRTAEETLLFFVPLAKYLGLMEAAEELRTMSFEVLGK